MRKSATRAFVLLLGVVLAGSCTVNVNEDYFFHPGPASSRTASVEGVTVERLTLDAADTTRLGGIRITQRDADLEILYFGGNASRADEMVAFLGPIVRGTRANLTMIDYRGYGRSAGTPTIANLKSDALRSHDQLRDGESGKPLVVHGVSLGGFVAGYVAANRSVSGLVLEATAPDAASWAKRQIPWFAKPMIRLELATAVLAESNVESVKRHSGPLLLMTGSKDSVTPPQFMMPIYDASGSAHRRTVTVKGARHGDGLAFAEARRAYLEFLDLVRTTARK